MANERGSEMAGTVRVWDPVVRIFHWSLVAAYAVAWLSTEAFDSLHEASGYAIGGLVALRLIWGVIGSRYARFSQFVRGPAATLAYLRDLLHGRERRYLGHNPAGAAMILALLATLAGTIFTGWLLQAPERVAMLPSPPAIVAPAWADDDDHERRDGGGRGEAGGVVKELHEVLANLTLLLVALHVGGVALASLRHRENLVRAMVTGEKRAPGPGDIA